MTAVRVTSKNLGKTQKELEKMAARAKTLRPAMQAAARATERFAVQRFRKQQGPAGKRWKALSPNNPRSTEPGHKILMNTGTLRSSLFAKAGKKDMRFGAAANYAATHQFGSKKRRIPERPYLPVDGKPPNLHTVEAGPSKKLWNRIRRFIINYLETGNPTGGGRKK